MNGVKEHKSVAQIRHEAQVRRDKGSLRNEKILAERGGFEPPVRFYPYNGLANRRLQPLGHLSAATRASARIAP
jgi:hypothetical protein